MSSDNKISHEKNIQVSKEIAREYSEFLNFDSKDDVANDLFVKIKKQLFPNPWWVFSKVVVIHTLIGYLSLGVCNQFGLNPFNTPYSLADFFMKTAGHSFCMVACGVLFLSLTYLVANIFLSREELESMRRYEWLQMATLSFASIAAFYFFGAELVGTFVVLWLCGALIGGLVSIELSYKLRRGALRFN